MAGNVAGEVAGMWLLWFALTVGIWECARCSDDGVKGRIIQGHKAKARQFPFFAQMTVVAEFYGLTREWVWCGGSIITRRHVLTAAHCFDGPFYETAPIHVYVGKTKITKKYDMVGEQKVRVKRVTTYERYGSRRVRYLDHDIAILELERPLKLTDTVQPIPLSDDDFDKEAYMNDDCHAMGYGRAGSIRGPEFEVTSHIHTRTLQTTKVNVEENKVCNYIKRYSYYLNPMRRGQLCAATVGGNTTCKGDSGSPLVCKDQKGVYRQVGVKSYMGNSYCSLGIAGNSRVSFYRSWIAGVLA